MHFLPVVKQTSNPTAINQFLIPSPPPSFSPSLSLQFKIDISISGWLSKNDWFPNKKSTRWRYRISSRRKCCSYLSFLKRHTPKVKKQIYYEWIILTLVPWPFSNFYLLTFVGEGRFRVRYFPYTYLKNNSNKTNKNPYNCSVSGIFTCLFQGKISMHSLMTSL